LDAWGIPYNGTGWNLQTGTVGVCVILFADSPEFLELNLGPAPGEQPIRSDVEQIRAKVGLEFLKRESLERIGDSWRLRFAGPKQARYQHSIQQVSVATVPKGKLAENKSPWILKEVRWRSAR
jgi:hypothetical protein